MTILEELSYDVLTIRQLEELKKHIEEEKRKVEKEEAQIINRICNNVQLTENQRFWMIDKLVKEKLSNK